jgi:hypothetical protein
MVTASANSRTARLGTPARIRPIPLVNRRARALKTRLSRVSGQVRRRASRIDHGYIGDRDHRRDPVVRRSIAATPLQTRGPAGGRGYV